MGVFTNKVLPKKGLEFPKNDEVVELVASSTTLKKKKLAKYSRSFKDVY